MRHDQPIFCCLVYRDSSIFSHYKTNPLFFQRYKIPRTPKYIKPVLISRVLILAINPFTPDYICGQKRICFRQHYQVNLFYPQEVFQVDRESYLFPWSHFHTFKRQYSHVYIR